MSATPITQDDRDVSYVAAEGQTEFAVTYKFQVDSDLVVSIVAEDDSETVLTLNVDYTVSGAGEDTGGTVTLLEGAIEGTEYRIRGEAKLVLYQKLTSANYSRATINTIFERCLIWITETLSKINVVQTAFDYFNSTTVPAIEQIKTDVDESLARIEILEQSASDSAEAAEAALDVYSTSETDGLLDDKIDKTPFVLLAIGQSNMASVAAQTGGDQVSDPEVYFWNATSSGDISTGTQYNVGTFGIPPLARDDGSGGYANNLAFQAAKAIKKRTGRPVYVLMVARGGHNIESWMSPLTLSANGWTRTNYDLYSMLANNLPVALSAVPGSPTTVDAMIIHQGEANSADGQDLYATKLAAALSDIAGIGSYVDLQQTPIVLGEIAKDRDVSGADVDWCNGHTHALTQVAQGSVGDATRCKIVSSRGIEKVDSTNVHFSGLGLEELGYKYADALYQTTAVLAERLRRVEGDFDPPTWFVPDEFTAGGRDIELVDNGDNDDSYKPMVWLERKVTGNTSRGWPAIMAIVGEVKAGGTKAISGIRAAMTNTGTNNDCVGLSARTTNSSNGGMSAGVFGAGAVTTSTANATMGVEGHIYVNSGETTAPRDGAGIGWRAAMHAYSDSLSSPAHHGLTIDSHGATAGYYGFWNGLTIDGNAFAHNGNGSGNVGTVGIQCGNWSITANYPEIGWKVGYVATYHIARGANEFKVNSNDFLNINPTGYSRFICRPLDTTFGGFRVEVDDGAGGYEGAAIFTWDGAATIVGNQRAEPIIFKTNDTERMRITAAGDIDTSGKITGDAVQSSKSDTTEGVLMLVGAGGLLNVSTMVPNISDASATNIPEGTWSYNNSTIGLPADLLGTYGVIRVIRYSSAAFRIFAWRNNGDNGRVWQRFYSAGSWQTPWETDYSAGNIIGTVSQSGGVPTGAAFETGSGTGYIYYKYADGRLEYIRDDATFAYVASADLLTFTETMAVTFTSDPTMISVCLPSNSSNYTGVTLNNIGCQRGFVVGDALTAQLPRTFGSPDFESGDNITNCKLMVTGRWF